MPSGISVPLPWRPRAPLDRERAKEVGSALAKAAKEELIWEEPCPFSSASASSCGWRSRPRSLSSTAACSARQGIPSFFCRVTGEIEAVFGPHEANWHLWLEQARAAGDERLRLDFAAAVVRARLRNLAALAVRFGWEGAADAAAELRSLAREAGNKSTIDALRGLEGSGAARAWAALAASLPDEWGFSGRARRPPPDPVNAMLSFGYTLLYSHCATALARRSGFREPRGALPGRGERLRYG